MAHQCQTGFDPPETKHLVSRRIWRELKHKVGYTRQISSTWEGEFKRLCSVAKGDGVQSTGMKLMTAAMIYWIWKARHERIFNNKTITPHMLVQLIWEDVSMKLGAIAFKIKVSQERDEMQLRWGVNIEAQNARREWTAWKKPDSRTHMLNTDGSLQNRQGFYASVIRKEDGKVVRAVQGKAESKSIDGIEMEVLLQGLLLAKKCGIERIQISLDSETVIKYVHSSKAPWELTGLLRRTQITLQNWDSAQLVHCYTEANKLADAIIRLDTNEK